MNIGKFISQTPVGSWIKLALAALLSQYLIIIMDANQHLWSYDSLRAIGIAVSVQVVPVVINWLNKQDPRYGKGKTTEIVDIESDTNKKNQ